MALVPRKLYSGVVILTTAIIYLFLSLLSYFDYSPHLLHLQWTPTLSRPVLLNEDGIPKEIVTYRSIRDIGIAFNASGSDFLVLLRIQKTSSGNFERQILENLDVGEPCICEKEVKATQCKCHRPSLGIFNRIGDNLIMKYLTKLMTSSFTSHLILGNSLETSGLNDKVEPWLFSQFHTGIPYQIHADWTEIMASVDKERKRSPMRRFFYVTMIRDPIHRFLSEFRHVQRGATWKGSRHICQNRSPNAEELGSCYSGKNWKTVNLKEFMSCPDNLAINRQTRMLADLSLVGCYNKNYMPTPQRNGIMLASAKRNLEAMAFFGLTEHQKASQYVFEETFKLRFKKPFTQNEDTYSKATLDEVSDSDLATIRQLNSLDVELYQFGEQLFTSRFIELVESNLISTSVTNG